MQNDLTRELLIRSISRELKQLHAIAKTFPQRKYEKHNSYDRNKMQGISLIIRNRRRELNELTKLDPLLSRQIEYNKLNSVNNRIQDFEYYEDPTTGEIGFCNNNQKTMLANYKRFNSIVFSIAPGWEAGANNQNMIFNPVIHWKDDFLEHIRNNDESCHDKVHHFRIENNFYGWDEYFKYDNQAWKRSEWALNNGQLVDLSKTIKVKTDLTDWHWPGIEFSHTEYMNTDTGETFENAKEARKKNQESAFIGFRIVGHSFPVNLFGYNFIYSLFVNNKKRYTISEGDDYLVLTKSQLEGCELRSSNAHKLMLGNILLSFAEKYTQSSSNTNVEIVARQAKNKFLSELKFQVHFVDKSVSQSKGIKEQIWRELFTETKRYSAFELQSLLPIATKLLQEEKKYAGHDR